MADPKSPRPLGEQKGVSGGNWFPPENAARGARWFFPQEKPAFWMEAYLEQYGPKA